MPRVLVTPNQFDDPSSSYFKPFHDAGFEIVFPPDQKFISNQEALLDLLDGVDAVLATTEPYTPEILSNTKLRVVARAGVGYDSVNVPSATENNVLVTITPGAVDISVAEHTVALIMAVYRDTIRRDSEVRSGKWSRAPFPRIDGKTIGIVGLGRIGKAVVPRVQGLGLKVIAYDPYPDNEFAHSTGVEYRTLDELLSIADIVSLHLPCTAESADMINAESLAKMKSDAVLINTGRGGLVDEEALYEAMSRGHLLGAALDVFKQEPTPVENKLLTLKNLVTTTHTAGLDFQSEIDMPRIATQCIVDLYQGKWPEHCIINRELRGKWKW